MSIARKQKQKRTAEEYAEELKSAIRSRFPEAEFELYKWPRREYDLNVYGDFDDLFDVLDLTAERTTDILVESGIHIHVLPLGRRLNRDS
jgi:hypothetical protein